MRAAWAWKSGRPQRRVVSRPTPVAVTPAQASKTSFWCVRAASSGRPVVPPARVLRRHRTLNELPECDAHPPNPGEPTGEIHVEDCLERRHLVLNGFYFCPEVRSGRGGECHEHLRPGGAHKVGNRLGVEERVDRIRNPGCLGAPTRPRAFPGNWEEGTRRRPRGPRPARETRQLPA
jgi:hypothetical protein